MEPPGSPPGGMARHRTDGEPPRGSPGHSGWLHLRHGLWHRVPGRTVLPSTERSLEGSLGRDTPPGCVPSPARHPTGRHGEPARRGLTPLWRIRRARAETGSSPPQVTWVTRLCTPVALMTTALPGVPRAPRLLQRQRPYPQSRKSWLARRPRGPGRPTLPRWALGAHQARVAFVAWDSRIPRLAIPTRSSFVTFDPGISLEEKRSVSASKGVDGVPSTEGTARLRGPCPLPPGAP